MSINWWIDTPFTMEHLEAGMLTSTQQKRLACMLKQKEEEERLPKTVIVDTAGIDDQTRAKLIAAVSARKAIELPCVNIPSDWAAVIESLVLSEVRRATLDHDQFHSPHEGWAVIREEVLEASNETGVLSDLCQMLDEKVRNDGVLTRHEELAQRICDVAIRGIRELIQVAATAQRYIYACNHKCGEFAKLPERRERSEKEA